MGPLQGVKVIELGAIGPGPFCCMLLADMGADVIRIDRMVPADLGSPADPRFNLLNRNKRSAAIDLKSPEGIAAVRRLLANADVLVEGFRPGVTERLGLGPKDCETVNPRLVYGRMTGWGQDGPLAQAAGHDINYIALAGALGAIGTKDRPTVPLNLVGDYGGGAVFLALGIVAAVLESRTSGRGQVVDAAMVDGVSVLMTSLYATLARGAWRDGREQNMLDGAAPFYCVYETSDGKHVAVGSIEARFFKELLERTGIDPATVGAQHEQRNWPALRERLAAVFRTKTRDEWCALMEGSDVCFAPVLSPVEAREHPHLRARGSVVEFAGIVQPAPAPRFGRTRSELRSSPALPGAHTLEVLEQAGFSAAEIEALHASKAVG
ncbi:CoA transferase [Ramlibacter sp. RBP-2]|uniref:CoA transferase n=1 Tax=Ramlibacter lithotrophicus TaxID=2606681 RepID=A0A7X6I8Y9_9BURK|nr:CaiB/BaiF CoA-transferase family protein [Ramlibacter lithotrophicus]NKE68875.1 CoA transferase [Ramlibacter lithotrophicus]